jgi:D-alanyl-lipoteichoic acid acyltransferase DltB (MBOAT superfamily)
VITFALGGLWHGASWTYLLWGAAHGVGLAVLRLLPAAKPGARPAWRTVLGGVLTFNFVAASWILFRCTSLAQAGELLARLGRGSATAANLPVAVVLVIVAVIVSQLLPQRWLEALQTRFATSPALAQATALVALAAALRLVGSSAPSPFIYLAY